MSKIKPCVKKQLHRGLNYKTKLFYMRQGVNSWLGFTHRTCAYNLEEETFVPYRFIKVEGVLPYGTISWNRAARRVLQ